MSRYRVRALAASFLPTAALLAAAPAAARQGVPPERIDILVDPVAAIEAESCSPAEEDAAAISGEIVVCARRDDARHRLMSRDAAQDRYARETMYAGDPQAPDVAGAGIFRGKPTVKGVCGIGLNPCPRPPAYMVDFSELPDAPPGSDADRIARGLPPLGQEEMDKPAEPALSPSGSASPAASPSG